MGWFRGTQSEGDDDRSSFEDRLAQISPGVPGRCPACDGLGYIDSIDIGHRYQIQHCKDCQHRWEYLFDADGTVVGLTELDPAGQPVARSRVRPLRAAPSPPPTLVEAVPAPPPVATAAPDAPEVVLDLRDPAPAETPVLDLTDPEQLSPAEWLRRSLHR